MVPPNGAHSHLACQIHRFRGTRAFVHQVSDRDQAIALDGPEHRKEVGEFVPAAVDVADDEGSQVTMSRLFAEPNALATCSCSGSGS